jgi:hypothetical protein
MEIANTMRTAAGDARMHAAEINPDANPATAALATLMPPEAHYLVRALPPGERGCAFPGRFDREDTSRNSGFGPPPGEGGCDYPQGCEYLGSTEMRCPHEPEQWQHDCYCG